MKDPGNSAAVGRAPEVAPESDDFVNRKLIRPSLPIPRRSESNGERPLTSAEQRVPKVPIGTGKPNPKLFFFKSRMAGGTPLLLFSKLGKKGGALSRCKVSTGSRS